jgi:hypothetical protein
VERPVSERLHDDRDRNAALLDLKSRRESIDHRVCQLEGRGDFLAAGALSFVQVIVQTDADGECAVFLHDVGVKTREVGFGALESQSSLPRRQHKPARLIASV